MDEDYHNVLACTDNFEELAKTITAKLRAGDRGGAISQLSECIRRRVNFNRTHPVRAGDTSHVDIIKFLYLLKQDIRNLPANADLHNIGVIVRQYLSLTAETQLYPSPDNDPRILTIPTGKSIYSVALQECPCKIEVERPFKQVVEEVYKKHIASATKAKEQFEIERSGSVVPEFRVGDFNEAVKITAIQHANPSTSDRVRKAGLGGPVFQSAAWATTQAVETEYNRLKVMYDAGFVNSASVSSDAGDVVRTDPVLRDILKRYEDTKNRSFIPIQHVNPETMWAGRLAKTRRSRRKRTLRRRSSKMDLRRSRI